MESRLAVLETKVYALEKNNDEDEATVQNQLTDIYARLRNVERSIWLATGGVIAVGGIATFFGWNILKALGN